MACANICLGDLKTPIEIVRRALTSASPGLAEPVHTYTPVFAPRAQVKTKGGTSPFSRVEVDGTAVTHVMTIRYTPIPFDTRDRVRLGGGTLYRVLKIENIDEDNRWLRLYCAALGDETANAVR